LVNIAPDKDSWTLLDSRMKEGKRKAVAVMVNRDMYERPRGGRAPRDDVELKGFLWDCLVYLVNEFTGTGVPGVRFG
jgi:hypothetical protein